MMLKTLICGYCTGVRASRKLVRNCLEDVAFRYLAANNFPDFRTISNFRQTYLAAFKELFLQALLLCKRAGLATLGHVALDGSEFKAHASKHKAMSYGRMKSLQVRCRAHKIRNVLDKVSEEIRNDLKAHLQALRDAINLQEGRRIGEEVLAI